MEQNILLNSRKIPIGIGTDLSRNQCIRLFTDIQRGRKLSPGELIHAQQISTLVQNISNTFSTTEVQSAGSTTGSFGRVEANVIQANEYIVSSSVTQITTQQISGSTLFGDSSDDTHQLTGSLLLDATAFKYGSTTWNQLSGENALTGSSWNFKASKGSGDLFNFVSFGLILLIA